jgi:hypothetical protein
VNSLRLPNPPLGCAFAAPFAKGGRQTRSDWRGDFCLRHALAGLFGQALSEAEANARTAGVTDCVRLLQQDLFETDIRVATVVTLFLLASVNLRLRPTLLRDLKPGARIVSHAFDMSEWRPDV